MALLLPLTFYPVVARRTLELLKVLDEIAGSADDRGALSARGKELVQSHFVGKKAWFTDESDENKRLFGKAMTFPNPGNANEELQCFWHGKIKTPQFRIHFECRCGLARRVLKLPISAPKSA